MISASPLRLLAIDTSAGAARALADKIIAALGPLESLDLTFRNLSSLDARQAAEAWRAVENEFRSRGIRLARESDATAKITVTLSENPQDYVWVAEISRDQARELVMVVQARPQTTAADVPLRTAIQTKLIIEQDGPILDLTFLDGDLLLLDTRHLSLYRKREDRWDLDHTAALAHPSPWPRDARGRLSLAGDSIQVRVPGLRCSGTARPAFSLECVKEESPWPLESGPANFESTKNYFVQGDLPPFFSSAGAREDGDVTWIFAGVDGRARLYDKAFQPAGTIAGWGSDIAGVDTPCGTKRQIFVVLPGDPSERGTVQAFEVRHGRAAAVSSPVDFPGPVTALWPVSTGDSAIAVSRDIRTGRYAAYHLSVACGH